MVVDDVPEDSSENKPRKRGRPRVIPEEIERALDSVGAFNENKTRRGRLNVIHRTRAMGVLGDDPQRFGWLLDKEKARDGTQVVRFSILAELGRIDDAETLKIMAARICELKPKARDAVVIIRRIRLGRSPEPSSNELFSVIMKAINAYVRSHPECEPEMIFGALALAKKSIELGRTEID